MVGIWWDGIWYKNSTDSNNNNAAKKKKEGTKIHNYMYMHLYIAQSSSFTLIIFIYLFIYLFFFFFFLITSVIGQSKNVHCIHTLNMIDLRKETCKKLTLCRRGRRSVFESLEIHNWYI